MATESPEIIERTDEEQKRANEIYDAYRDELLKRQLSNTENYDKAILTLSSAALAISLAAIRFIIPLEQAEHIWLLKTGWIILLFSITISLVAYLLSNKAIDRQMKIAELYYAKARADAPRMCNTYSFINNILNYSTGVLFIAAIAMVVFFVTLNLEKETEQMTDDKSESSLVDLHESASVPAMQKVSSGVDKVTKSATIPKIQPAPDAGAETSSGTDSGGQTGSGSSEVGSSSNSGSSSGESK